MIFTQYEIFIMVKSDIAQLQIEPNQNQLLKNLKGSIFAWLVVLVVVHHAGDSSNVTLAFEDAQVIQTLMDVG